LGQYRALDRNPGYGADPLDAHDLDHRGTDDPALAGLPFG
jgi:hypothetical protein